MKRPTAYDTSIRAKELTRLPPGSRVAFALLCAERLLPGYTAYAKSYCDDVGGQLPAFAAALWDDIQGLTELGPEDLHHAVDACLALAPTEDAPSWGKLHALADDAVSAVAYAYRTRITDDCAEAAEAARTTLNAIDMSLNYSEDLRITAVEPSVLHPLIQEELDRQARDIRDLAALPAASHSRLLALRHRATRDAPSVLHW